MPIKSIASTGLVQNIARRGVSIQQGRICSVMLMNQVRSFASFTWPSELHAPPFNTLSELIVASTERYGPREGFGVKKDGKFSFLTYSEVGEQVVACRGALASLGVKKGDRVAIISRNRLEWVLTAYGGYGLGAINVPMYEQQKESDWRYIIKDSGAKILIVSTIDIYEKVKTFAFDLGVERVFCCDLPEDHVDSFAQLMAAGRENPTPVVDVQPSDLATLIYTSGTTGTPKGVMLSHGNICSNVKGIFDQQPDFMKEAGETELTCDDRSLSFLPWAHSYGQTAELHSGIALGASSGIAAGAPGDAVELLANIQEVQPTMLFSVPTLFKRVYDNINKKIADEPSPVKRFLMNRAIEVGLKVNQLKLKGDSIGPFLAMQHRFLDKVVLSKMRAALGGKLKLAVVGGAPTPLPVILFMEALGIKMTEGYGLTETSPVISTTFSYPEHRILGTVGVPFRDTEIRVVLDGKDVPEGEEGELWVAGPQVMQGYWNKPEATAEVIVEEGGKRWFRTGDLGSLIDGNIKITGRSKEQYKLENGKYVAPAPIEQAMSMSKFVSQCVLYGAGHPYNVAVIVPDFEALADELGMDSWYNTKALCKDPKVEELMKKEVERVLTENDIKKYEQPQALLLIPEAFSAANEMLTPKLSIRKPNVIKAYKDQLDALYDVQK